MTLRNILFARTNPTAISDVPQALPRALTAISDVLQALPRALFIRTNSSFINQITQVFLLNRVISRNRAI